MSYPREDIDRVRERTDLAELAAEVTKVKRTGRSVMAVCPFHQEKTPSLSIDPARGLYHCFGCGKSGDVFRWVQETQGVDFVSALELLARRAGVTLTEDPSAKKRRSRREELVGAVETAVEFFHDRLRSGSDAGAARSYLRSRGYEAEVVGQFRLGYSPDSWDALVGALKREGIGERTLVDAGLASRSRTGRLIDRFRGRVMFPIFDVRGDAVGFGARRLDGDGPKYLNSPETPIYQKSRLLYGLNWAKSDIVRRGEAIVVEGYTDVIGFFEAGLPVAVATCGTALGDDHLDLLRRFTERVVLAFDADDAGAEAALRGFEKSVPGDLDLRVALLPEGRDPADLVRQGEVEMLKKSVGTSTPLLQFRIERELAGFDLSEAEARGRAVRAAADLVARHPDSLVRHEYAVMLSRRTGVDLEAVEGAVRAAARASARPAARTGGEPPSSGKRLTGEQRAERELLRLYLANHPVLRDAEIDGSVFTLEEHLAAFNLVEPAIMALPDGTLPDLGSLIGSAETPEAALLRRLALVDRPLPDAEQLVNRLKISAVERRIEEVRRTVETVDPDVDPQGYSSILGELIALEKQRRELRSQE